MRWAAPVDRARAAAQPQAVVAVAAEIQVTRLAAAAVAVVQAVARLPELAPVALAAWAEMPVLEQAEMPGPAMVVR